ncbi:DNA sulfur modification protein DndD, partial [Fischerella thermalis WC559]
MIFLELVLQNFGPYNGRQVIKLDPKLNDCTRPILLLGGMNGGGKTTLMDAIRLALYGHRAECSTRGNLSYADFLTQCVNSKASPHEQTRVELVFEHIENDKPVKYKIVRAWEKNPKEGKDSLGIFGDDDTWSIEALVNTWDDYIENILPLGISNLFLFDGEQVKELAEQEVPPPIVVDAIRALLGLELAERLAVDIEILVNRKRKEIAEKDDLANLEDIENELKQIQEEFEVNKLSYANLQEELKLFEQQYQEAENKFISEGGKIAAERSYLDKQKQEKTAEAEQIRQKMTQLASNVLPLVLIQPLLTQVQTQGEKEFHARQAQIVQDILLERDQRLLDLIGKLDIAKESLNKIKVFLEEDEYRRNSSALPEQPWLLADDEALSQLGNVIYYLHNAKISAKQLLASLKNKEEEILTIERQIQTAASPEAYDRLRDTMQKAQKQV